MLPQKSAYLRKIAELHKEIEGLALKLQHTREEIEKGQKEREQLLISIEASKNVLADLRLDNFNVRKSTIDWRKSKDKELKTFERKFEDAEQNLKKVLSEEKILKQKLAKYNRLDSDIKAHEEKLNGLKTDYTSMKLSINELSSEISALESEKRKLDKDIEKARGQADKILESATLTAQDAHAFYETVGPWINAIAQWHAVHGGEMPQLLHNWKSRQIVVSSQIHKILKRKTYERKS